MNRPLTILLYLLSLATLLISVPFLTLEDSRETRPRIISYDGNLMFHAGFNRDISFNSEDNSSIFIGHFNAAILKNISMFNISNQNITVNKHAHILDIMEATLDHESIFPMETEEMKFDGELRMIQEQMNNISRAMSKLGIDSHINEMIAKATTLNNLLEYDFCMTEAPCKNGGTCISFLVGYTCICPEDKTGSNCESIINKCELYEGTPNECQNNAICSMDEMGNRICICEEGFYGERCESKLKSCKANEDICGHGYCIDSYAKEGLWYFCACKQGSHVLNETHPVCVDIDECASNPCHNGVQCVNLPGRFVCSGCPHGYESIGGRCVDIDECSSHNRCSKNPLVRCINTMGSFHCDHCPFGFDGDGFNCTRVNACDANPCHENAECFENRGELLGEERDFVCMCKQGYMGDAYDKLGAEGDKGCAPFAIHPANNPCQKVGVCGVGTKECRVIDNSTFRCICENSHYGSRCDLPSPCYSDPCKNEGKCVPLNRFQFQCDCRRGFYGDRCELVEDGCVYHSREPKGRLDFPVDMISMSRICDIIIDPPRNESLHLGVYVAPLTFPNHTTNAKFCTNASNSVTLFDGVSDRSHSHLVLCENEDGVKFPEHPMTSGSVLIRVKGDGIKFKLHWEPHPNWRDMKLITLTGKSGYLHIKPKESKVVWFISAESISSSFLFEIPPFNYTKTAEILLGDRYDGEMTFKGSSLGDYTTFRVDSPFAALKMDTQVSCSHCQEIVVRWTTVETSSCGSRLEWDRKSFPFAGTIQAPLMRVDLFNEVHLQSPHFPKDVSPHTSCTWSINSTLSSEFMSMFDFKISLNYFDIPSLTEDCHDDFLKFTSLDNRASVDAREMCNKQPPTIGNSLDIPYKTPVITYRTSGLTGGGFSMNFKMSCDKYLDQRAIISTSFTSVGFPFNCTYTMRKSTTSSNNEIILIKFQHITKNLICNSGSNGYDRLTINTNNVLCDAEEEWAPMYLSYRNDVTINYQTRGQNESNFSFIIKKVPELDCTSESPVSPSGYFEVDRQRRPGTYMCIHHLVGEDRITMEIAKIQFPDNKTRPYTDVLFHIYDYYYDEEIKGTLLKTLTIDNVSGVFVSEFRHLSILVLSTSSSPEIPAFSMIYAPLLDNCDLKFTTPADVIVFDTLIGRPCDYVIELPSTEHTIAMSINSFNVPCEFGSLVIRNGKSISSPVFSILGKESEICLGKSIPKSLRSQGNSIFMRFVPKKQFFESMKVNISYEQVAGGCGGHVEGTRGEIASPQYPHESTENYDCVWRISVPPGNDISLDIVYMENLHPSQCQNDSVSRVDASIFDDHAISPIHRKQSFCSNPSDGEIRVESSLAAVRYRQKGSKGARGFLIKFTAVCDGVKLYKQAGTIQSASFPYLNSENRICSWRFENYYESKLKIIFHNQIAKTNQMFSNRENNTCGGYNLTLSSSESDGGGTVTVRDPLFGEITSEKKIFCSTDDDIVQIIEPSGRLSIDVQFHETDQNLFWISYSHEGCIHYLTSPGVIEDTVGDVHDSEMASKPCYWNIRAEVGQKITVIITVYESQSERCTAGGYEESSLQVYGDFDFKDVRAILKRCSRVKEPIIVSSSGHEMMIYAMVKKEQLPKRKDFVYFRAEISFSQASDCGGKIKLSSHEERTVIHSPGYPKSYESGLSCTWSIEAPHGHSPEFHIEHTTDNSIMRMSNNTCVHKVQYEKLYFESIDSPDYDYVICDDLSTPSHVLDLKSTQVNIHFTSGYELERIHTNRFFVITITLNCGGVLYAADKRKEFNVVHAHDSRMCKFRVIKEENAPASSGISVTLTRFNRRKIVDDKTELPSVSIDGGDPIPIKFGRTPIEFEATSVMWFNVSHHYDLSIDYSLTSRACGGELNRMSGSIHKKVYQDDLECNWRISNTPGNRIYIKYRTDIPNTPFCTLAYLEIRMDGKTETKRLCEENKNIGADIRGFTSRYVYNDNSLSITFKYHGDNPEREYSVWFDFERYNGGYSASRVMESPPVIDGNNTSWMAIAAEGKWIQYKFERMDLPYNNPLKVLKYDDEQGGYAFVEEHRGQLNADYEVRERIIESNDVKFVWVHDNGITPVGGFRLSWQPIDIHERVDNEVQNRICGGQLNLTNTQQHISFNSSMYEGDDILCVWTLPRPFLKSIRIEFFTDFPERNDCDFHRLAIKRNSHHVRSRDFVESVCYTVHSERYEHIDENMIVSFSSSFRSTFSFKLIYWTNDGSVESIPDNGRKYSFALTPHTGYTSAKKGVYVFESENVRLKEARLVSMHLDADTNCSSYLELAGITTERFCDSTMNSSILIPFHEELRVTHFTAPQSNSRDIIIEITKKVSTCSELYVLDMANRQIDLSWKTPMSCEWTVTCPQKHRIKFEFTALEQRTDHSFIHMYDGPSSHSKLIESLSLTFPGISRGIYSTSNHMHVVVEIPETFNLTLAAVASIASCGGHISLSEGRESILTSSNFPHIYEEEGLCKWTVSAGYRDQITIRINTLHLIPSDNCELDYLEIEPIISEGNGTNRICGNDGSKPIQLLSAGRLLTITLNANSTEASRRSYFTGMSGFNISLSINEFSCGQEITDDFGVINHPSNPDGGMRTESYCEWVFKAGPMQIYQLEIEYLFENEDEANAMNDEEEHRFYTPLELFDGKLDKNRYERGRSFTQHRTTLETMTDLAVLRFKFDHTWRHNMIRPFDTGFRINYRKISSTEFNSTCQLLVDEWNTNSTGSFKITMPEMYGTDKYSKLDTGLSKGENLLFCHILISRSRSIGTTSVTLSNPSGSYFGFDACAWQGQYIQIEVPTGKLSMDKEICANDFARSFINNNESTYQISTLSSDIHIYTSSHIGLTNQLEFTLNFSFNDCGGLISDPSGNLSLPRYIPNDDCQWIFEAPLGMVVSIEFSYISIEESPGCAKDAIVLGEGETNTPVRRICYRTWAAEDYSTHEKFLWKYRSRSRLLILSWKTDGETIDFERKGWSLNYRFEDPDDNNRDCGYAIHGESGVIQSPNQPKEDYSPNLACEWTISVPEGYKMLIHFNMIDIEHSEDCKNDYMKIWSEEDDHYFEIGKRAEYLPYKWKVVGTYCQYTLPSDIVVGEKARIDFVSNGRIGGKGFEITFQSICGGNYTRESGEILSPHYPEYLPDNTQCTWLIDPNFENSTKIITIIFEDVDLRDESMPGSRRLVLRDYSARRIVHIFTENSEFAPKESFTIKGPAQITFHSGNIYGTRKHSKRRFRIRWISKKCDQLISLDQTNDYRTILRPNDDFPIYGGYSCVVYVRTTEERSVEVKLFNAINEEEISCEREFVTIAAGNFTDNKEIGKYCGDHLRSRPITTNSSEVLIRFHSTDGHSKIGVNLQAKALGLSLCVNRLFTAEQDVKKRIEIKQAHVARTFCNFAIETNATSRIKITIQNATFIETPPGTIEKETDGKLTILEGLSATLTADESLAWASLPRTILTSQSCFNCMFALVKWNDSPGNGYSYLTYEYQEVPAECGGQLIAHRHSKTLVYRPQSNISGLVIQRCEWVISSYPPAPIYFRLKTASFSGDPCKANNDYLQIEDSGEAEHCDHPECSLRHDEKQIIRTCYSSIPFVSRSSTIKITTSTRIDGLSSSHVDTVEFEYYSLDNCDRTIYLSHVPSSHIVSPFFPRKFGNNTDCTTMMRIKKDSQVLIVFRYFGLHDLPDDSTSLTIRSGDKIHCCFRNQSLPSPFIADGDISVRVSSKRAGYGYDISYFTTFSKDPSLIVFERNYDIRGAISQPGYPNGYAANTTFKYSFSAPSDGCIFTLEDAKIGVDCSREETLVLSYFSQTGRQIAQGYSCYAEELMPFEIKIPHKTILNIEFKTDGLTSNDGRGFRGTWNCPNYGVENYAENTVVYH